MPRRKSTIKAPHVRLTGDAKRRRDANILRLWCDGWTGGKIAEHLDIKSSLVRNVVHEHDAARKPRRVVTTVGAEDAPIEAWQQAMLPKLEEAADTFGMSAAHKRATVFLGLLRHKPYDDIEAFKIWVHQVTGYESDEIAAFVERGTKGFLIIDGQPNDEAFEDAESDGEAGYLELVLMAGLLQGEFRRTADGQYGLSEEVA